MFKKKQKKPLSDKAKQEQKKKVKHIIKIVLDVLVYGFALFMVAGLLLGSCSSKPKVASAYYESDNGYTSITNVDGSLSSSSSLRYYYDYNYKKTFPSWADLRAVFNETGHYVYCYFVEPFVLDNIEYTELALEHPSNDYYYILIYDDRGDNSITLANFTPSDTNILRSDLINAIFSGNYRIRPANVVDINQRWYKFLVYYFGELGYNRITYNFPVSIMDLSYLFVNNNDNDNLLENGYIFKNDAFGFDTTSDRGQTFTTTVFQGSFRSNGVYYSAIEFRFSSVYGQVPDANLNYYKIYYTFPGSSTDIDSMNEFYKGYWYLDTIAYTGQGHTNIVWNAFQKDLLLGSDSHWAYVYDINWYGDTPYSVSKYRDLYIYHALDSFSGDIHRPFSDIFPVFANSNYAEFLNYIGTAYPSGNSGIPQDNTAPFVSVFSWLRSALAGIMPMLSYTLIPGITIGTLIMVPITMTIVMFVIHLFKR